MWKFLLHLVIVLAVVPEVAQAGVAGYKTVFEHAEQAWAVGSFALGRPMTFREGKLLVFPTSIRELTWAPNNTKPRNLMLVHEILPGEEDKPFFSAEDVVFAPIRLLPQHSYWKDNLPLTRRHEIAGGRRNVFRGAEAEEAALVLGTYLGARSVPGLERWKVQIRAVASALEARSAVLRDDAARYLVGYRQLGRDFPASAAASLGPYLEGEAPIEDKGELVDALAAAKVKSIQPVLERLAVREDALGALALVGLRRLGVPVRLEDAAARSHSASAEVRAWAARLLGAAAAGDPGAMERARGMLEDSGETLEVRAAAAAGLGESGTGESLRILLQAVGRGDQASRAAATAVALSGLPGAGDELARIVESGRGEAAIAAAAGAAVSPGCTRCVEVLREQHESHPDQGVRNVIGYLLEAPVVHKH